jgi:hypothetical protein
MDHFSWEVLQGKNLLDGVNIQGRIILKCILKKYVREWSGLGGGWRPLMKAVMKFRVP